MLTRREVVLSLLGSALGAACSRGGRSGPVGVAVASSFAPVASELGAMFRDKGGHAISVSSGSTGTLHAQIVNGAPFDAFLSADAERPADLERRGLGVRGSRFAYALGRLALYGPGLSHPDDGLVDLRAGAFRHLSIANPEIAPYGRAAREVLERLGLWAALGPRLVRGQNIAQAQQFVEDGGAELGLVALSAVRVGARHRHFVVPATLHEPIRQEAILLERGARSEGARGFLDYLKGAEARSHIERAGFATVTA